MNIRPAKKNFEDYFKLMKELHISEIKTSKKDSYLKSIFKSQEKKNLEKNLIKC